MRSLMDAITTSWEVGYTNKNLIEQIGSYNVSVNTSRACSNSSKEPYPDLEMPQFQNHSFLDVRNTWSYVIFEIPYVNI